MPEEQPENGEQGKQGGEDGGTPEAPVSFEVWLQQQPETVRALADAHVSGLRSGCQSFLWVSGNLRRWRGE